MDPREPQVLDTDPMPGDVAEAMLEDMLTNPPEAPDDSPPSTTED
jgi:hypothetical protein